MEMLPMGRKAKPSRLEKADTPAMTVLPNTLMLLWTITFARELMEDPAYRNVKAVKNRKMVYVSDRYRYVASHHIVDAVENIAYAVYPELFPEGKPEDQE